MAFNLRHATAIAAASFIGSGSALALDQVKVMIPAGPGGGFDQTGRNLLVAMQAAGSAKSAQFTNKGGAGGAIGLAEFVNTSKGDPHALFVSGLVTVGSTAMNKSPVTLANITPVARLTAEAEAIIVPASSPHKTMKDLVAALKANPGAVAFSGGSAGGTDHILAGLIAKEVGVDPAKVNYVAFTSGAEAVAAVLGGSVVAGISGYGEFVQHIKSGRVRALATSGPERVAGSDIPTLKEQGINVELVNWRGVFGAPGITPAQTKDLITAVEAGVNNGKWKETLQKLDWAPYYLAGDAFKAFVESEQKRVTGVLDTLNLTKK
ncbi:MAG TPA: tripartite tricarboxylate transporter substrate-binding protein [Casimicrobiaceae bacterium]|nr:tripartite tricarboxylate transporter substrate-binding protein [Casimicrobiaceae bacterium]